MEDFISEASFWVPDCFAVSAWIEHAPFAFWLLDVHRPGLLVELGTYYGFSYFVFNQALKRLGTKSRSFAIDTWRGDEHSGFYGEEVFKNLHDYNYRHYGDFSELIRATFDEAVGSFHDGTIDLLHIDGRHFYQDVRHDFETWKPKLSKRGIVLLHDTRVLIKDFGVHRLWEELTEQYPHFEFSQGHGLGVLGVGPELPERLNKLFAAAEDERLTRQVSDAYARLGDALVDHVSAKRADSSAANLESPEQTRLRAEVARLEREKQTLEFESATLQHDDKTLEHDVRQLEHDLRAREHEHAKLEQHYQQLKNEHSKLQHDHSQLQHDHSQLQHNHSQIQHNYSQLERKGRELEAEYENLREERGRNQVDRDTLARRLQRVEDDLRDRQALNSKVLSEQQGLQAKLSQAAGAYGRLEGELERQKSELNNIFSSFSWHVTAPLRWGSNGLRSARRYLSLVFRILWWLLTFQLRIRMRLRAEKRVLLESGLFDRMFYLDQNPDVAQSRLDPVEHYLRWGANAGRNPNPVFDTNWYLAQTPNISGGHTNALFHYLRAGWKQGRNPGLLFDIGFYLHENPDVAKATIEPLRHYLACGGFESRDPHPLFDSDWYLAQNPDVTAAGQNPLIHYLSRGWHEGRCPHPLFDGTFYLVNNPDLAKAGINALEHYLRLGGFEGRDPHVLFDSSWYLSEYPDVAESGINPLLHYLRSGWKEGRSPCALFDGAFYLEQYPDVAAGTISSLEHYLRWGAAEGRDPHPLFDSDWYLAQNPDVAAAGQNPLIHYLSRGWQEGRSPHPLFDGGFYLANNPDVAKAGINALEHYLRLGGFEGRDPHVLFDSSWYLSEYPDVAESGINPLLHYLRSGWKEGRSPCALFDAAFYFEQYPDVAAGTISSLEHYLRWGAAEGRDPSASFDTDWYRAQNADVASSGLNPLVHYADHGMLEGRPARAVAEHLAKHRTPGERVRVVFISGEPNTPGHRYRVENLAAALAPQFFDVAIIKINDLPAAIGELSGAHLVWIWRAPWSEKISAVVEAGRRGGAKIVFDVDDLMFRPELAVTRVIDGIRSMGLTEPEVQKLYSAIRVTMDRSDHCTVPTTSLAKEVKDLWKPVSIIPNGFDRNTFESAKIARGMPKPQDGLTRIGYATGSRTHQRDLAVAAPALAAVLSERPSARLVLFRRAVILEELPELRRVEDQIEWRELVSVDQLPFEYARFDINIAPLEVGNRFCETKSELKFFEAALVGVPTIASPTCPFSEAIRHGETGFLARTHDDWYNCLHQLVENHELRQRLADRAYREVLWSYGPERCNLLVTRFVNRLVTPPCISSELFLREAEPRASASPPEISIPAYDVLYQSERNGNSRVTVVIPLFNYDRYLEGALESVRQQTLRNIDIVIVDDQSTDNSIATAKRWLELYGPEFNMVALIQNRNNSKLGPSRNAGVSFCNTELFFPLDPDNLLLANCIEKCIDLLDETGAAYVYPTIEVFGDRTEEIGLLTYDPAYFQCGNYIDAMALIRKAAWIAVGGYGALDPQGYEDYDFWCKLVEKGMFGARLNEVVARYRAHGSSMLCTITEVPENKKEILRGMISRHPWLKLRSDAEAEIVILPECPEVNVCQAQSA